MPKFTPEPVHDEAWWKGRDLMNIIGFDKVMCDGDANGKAYHVAPENWVASVNYASEPFAPIGGYEVVFPTATDCLYWIRWMLLPYDCDVNDTYSIKQIELFGNIRDIAEVIDSAPDGTDAGELIMKLRIRIIRALQREELALYYIKPGEDYLRNLEDPL